MREIEGDLNWNDPNSSFIYYNLVNHNNAIKVVPWYLLYNLRMKIIPGSKAPKSKVDSWYSTTKKHLKEGEGYNDSKD